MPYRRMIIGFHMIWTGYGFWLPNDLRGSGSDEIRNPALEPLGPIHHGRRKVQPSKSLVRAFYREANPLLEHEPLWFRDRERSLVTKAIQRVIEEQRYVNHSTAICSNHVHQVLQRTKHDAVAMWNTFASRIADALRDAGVVSSDHPVWADRPYKVFLYTPDDMRRAIRYVEGNPLKEGLERQFFPFVTAYRY